MWASCTAFFALMCIDALETLASIDMNADESKEGIVTCKAWTDQKERGILIGRNEGIVGEKKIIRRSDSQPSQKGNGYF